MTHAESLNTVERRYTDWLPRLIIVLLLIALIGVVYWFSAQEETPPADDSPEAGFARDMILHHSQAVEMAVLVYDRGENPTLRTIALDMLLTQQAQIGHMQAWLNLWEIPFSRADLPMAWMGTPVEGLMPGMASDEQLSTLRAAEGEEADRLFIELMIPHHESGIHMAEAILERTDLPVVRALARSIIDAQQREIEELQLLADEPGSEPAPLHQH